MLQITARQMAVFEAQARNGFVDRTIRQLTPDFPAMNSLAKPMLEAFVREQIENARGYGFESEQDFTIYVMSAWLLGGDFDTRFAPPRIVFHDAAYGRDDRREWLLLWTHEIFAQIARGKEDAGGLQPPPA